MTAPAWLIAGREFRAYAATASFWVALAIGPLILGGALLTSTARPEAGPRTVSLTLSRDAEGRPEALFSPGFPLQPAAQDQVLRIIGQELGTPVRLTGAPSKPPVDGTAISRFVRVMMLWMTLVGSLGMLLQAVVRERANRALESLMAAASAGDIVLGKLIGVGAVSLLVLGAWLGAAGLMAIFAAKDSAGLLGPVLQALGQPIELLRASAIYLLAFGFYGLLTIAVGALARDNADAQNLARPVFAVLLAVFFAALVTTGGGAGGLAWLVYLPPFTPFMLLLGDHAAATEFGALAGLAVSTALAALLAVRALKLNFDEFGIRGPVKDFVKTWPFRAHSSAKPPVARFRGA